MLNKVLIMGAGGMAREVYQVYMDLGKEKTIAGFIVNTASKKNLKELPKVLKNVSALPIEKKVILINGIGSPLRKEWIASLEKEGYLFDKAIHPSTVLGHNISMGNDVVICANNVLTRDISIGNHVIINVNCSISHDVLVESFVTISPGVNIGGRVKIGEGTFVGIGSCIIQDISIGKNVIIGAGSVVVDDIPDDTLVFGCPAKPIRKITREDFKDLF